MGVRLIQPSVFWDGAIKGRCVQSIAVNAAASEILSIKQQSTRYGWQECVGSSGHVQRRWLRILAPEWNQPEQV